MKIRSRTNRKARIEILPLIDIVFLLLVFFIYAMLSMAVHRGLPVQLPSSRSAAVEKTLVLAVTVRADGSVYLDGEPVSVASLSPVLAKKAGGDKEAGVLLFADRHLPYQTLFRVLDQIRAAGLERVSLQAEAETKP